MPHTEFEPMAFLFSAAVMAQQLFACVAAGGLAYISYLLIGRRDTGWQLAAIGWGTAWAIVTSYDLVRLICWYRAFTGVRGKYVARLRKGSNIVVLEPEIAEAFPSAAAVNEALRGVLNTTKAVRRIGGLPNKALQPTRAAEPNGKGEASRRGPRG